MNVPAAGGRLAHKIINNTSLLVGSEFFSRVAGFVAGILIARSLGRESYGQFSLVYTYLAFFETFVQFGLNSILVRELSQSEDRAGRILGNAVLFRIALIILAFPVSVALMRALGYPMAVRQAALLAYFQLFLSLRSIYETIFRVHLALIYPACWNAIRGIANVLLVAMVAWWQPALPWFILAYMVSGAIAFAGIASNSRRFQRLDFRFDWPITKHLIREAAPLVASAYLTLLYYRIDVFMISKMRGFGEVGCYSVAMKVTESLAMIASAVMASLFPVLARSFKEDRAAFERQIMRASEAFFLLGFPIALGSLFVSRDLILLLFGPEYASSAPTLAILCWHIFFAFQGTLLANTLIVCGRQKVDMWISFFLVFLNIALNALLIPKWGFAGAAVATVATEAFGAVFYLTYASRDRKIAYPISLGMLGRVVKINVIFFIYLVLLNALFRVRGIPLIFSGAVFYGGLLMLERVITWQDASHYLAGLFKVSRMPKNDLPLKKTEGA